MPSSTHIITQLGITRSNVTSLVMDVVAQIILCEIAPTFPDAPIADDVVTFPTIAGGLPQGGETSSRADSTTNREIKGIRGMVLKPIMPLTPTRNNMSHNPTITQISIRMVSNGLP